jgi:hypothetical protein
MPHWQPFGYVVMSPDPRFLKRRAPALDVALCLRRVATQGARRRGYYAPLVEHCITWERACDRLEDLFLGSGDAHLPQNLAQHAPTLIRLEHPGRRKSKRGGRGLCAHPPAPRPK